jgi:hypothetical protein
VANGFLTNTRPTLTRESRQPRVTFLARKSEQSGRPPKLGLTNESLAGLPGPEQGAFAVSTIVAILIIAGATGVLRVSIYFGSKWVDKMLHFEPIDPSKPIIRPPPRS